MPRGAKPGERRGGRAKGTPNKMTKVLKDVILGALDDVGGQKYLAQQAKANPAAFMSLLGRLVPQELKAEVQAQVNAQLDPAKFFADLFRRPDGS